MSQSWKRQWGYKKEKEEKHIKGLTKGRLDGEGTVASLWLYFSIGTSLCELLTEMRCEHNYCSDVEESVTNLSSVNLF